jgi:CheY-like chemotaxis protein
MAMHKKASILVVDDEELIRNLVCLMLSKLNYRAVSARNASEALTCLANGYGIDLVLTDINMPIIDGWELAIRIKALKPCVPIVALTGESPSNIFPRLKGSGINHALFKPLKMDVLRDALSSILKFPRDDYVIECLGSTNDSLRTQNI